jgi:membrane-associated protease RseP (regulator of RpoE activity)
MAVVLANADGSVYHRYGGRTDRSPMSMEGLVSLMKGGLVTHKEYLQNPAPPKPLPPLLLPQLASDQLKGRIAPMFGCFHCHYAREAKQYLALEAGTWTPDQFWIYPEPERIGLTMHQNQQSLVQAVLPDSAAERAGIQSGDQLQTLHGTRVLSKYDIQWILDELDSETKFLPFTLQRKGQLIEGQLDLKAGWKVGNPDDYAWRVRNVYTEHMSKFLPAPGFTGEQLTEEELLSHRLPVGTFALKITQLNYGTHLAGVHRGDIVLSAGGKSKFSTLRNFYFWCESLRRSGRDLRLQLLRQGSELSLMVSQDHLNYSKVERAPRATLGFIVQQLPGADGLRVGNVDDGCGAELAGIKVGDRIGRLDDKVVTNSNALKDILHNKNPGEMLTIDITRNGHHLQIGFILAGEEKHLSNLAHLSSKPARFGQDILCEVTIKLPPDKHIYSMHRSGFGVPTQLEFRGRGFKLLGQTEEPEPRRVEQGEGLEPTWIMGGTITLRQKIQVTNPDDFHLLIQVYAQVCDDRRCHEFRAVIENDGSEQTFSEFLGHFDQHPEILRTP